MALAERQALTIGESLGYMISDMAGVGATVQDGSWDVVWINPLTSHGPGFRWTYLKLGSGVLAGANYVVVGAQPTPVPLSWALGFGNPNRILTFNTGSLELDSEEIANSIVGAMTDCIEDICGATTAGSDVYVVTIPGQSKPFVALGTILFGQAKDARQFQIEVVDFSPDANVIGPQFTPSILNQAAPLVIQNPNLNSGSGDPLPYDLDVAINNGANIFSVVSKTFTEPSGE